MEATARSHWTAWLPVALFTLLWGWSAATWLPTHDEGVTWRQAFGAVPLARLEPVPMATLRSHVSGAAAHGAGAVLDAMMAPGGMQPPGHPLLLRSWAAIGGAGSLWLAVPAWLLGCAGLLAFRALAARSLGSSEAGLFASLWLAASPWLVAVSSGARPYGVSLALFLISSWLVPGLRAPGAGAARAAFAGVSALGLYCLYHYAFGLLFQAAWVALDAWRERDRSGAWRAAAAFAAAGLLYLPWLPRLARHLASTASAEAYFRGVVPLAEWPAWTLDLGLRFVLGEAAFASPAGALAWLSIALAVVAIGLLARRPLPPSGLWAASPMLPLSLALADRLHGSHTLFVSKTAFALLPLLALFAGRALWSLPRPAARGASGLVLAACLASSIGAIASRAPAAESVVVRAAALARARAEPHWLAIPSLMPGYAWPLLRALEAEGFEGSVVYAPVLDLDPLLERASEAGVARLTLLDLAVDYGPAQRWGAPGLARMARRARARGWRRPGERGRGPVLEIVSPVTVRYLGF